MSSSKAPTYPASLCLNTMPVLVVGAGRVGLRKVQGLLAAGARVTVVAPEVEPEITTLAREGHIELRQRPYASGEAAEYRLVLTATGDERVDWQVSYDAAVVGTFVNAADVPERCTFFLPAVVRRGHLNLSVTTDGAAPFAARRLRERLEALFGEGYAEWLECAAVFRAAVLAAVVSASDRDNLFDRFCQRTLPPLTAATDAPTLTDESEWRGWIREVAPEQQADSESG